MPARFAWALAFAAAACSKPRPPEGPPTVAASELPECGGVAAPADTTTACIDPDQAARAQGCLDAMTRRSFELSLRARELTRARAEERSFDAGAGTGRRPGELFDLAGEEGEVRVVALGVGTAPPRTIAAADQSGQAREVSLSLVSTLARDPAGQLHPVELAPTLIEERTVKVCDCVAEPDPPGGPTPRFWAHEIPGDAAIGPPVRVPFELHLAVLQNTLTDAEICR